ncbi:hypothetical protein [Thalassobacillus hwangdonensis]|uniref:Ribosomal protein L7/L12 C-terminal domain-containing protein n=1 Tax=Thalassobacillus hwangdonensis TaxID=546108 RepID=A0ABW3L3L8_9BACI
MELTLQGGLAFLVLFFLLLGMLSKLKQMEQRMSSMNQRLEQLAEYMGLPENPEIDKLRILIEEGKDIEAVKEARKAFGFSLVEGKRYIDSLKASMNSG